MLRRILFLLLVLAFSMPGLESWALPKSLIMTTELVSKEGGRNIKANAKIWYSNMKFRTEVESNMAMTHNSSPVQVNNRATVIMDLNQKVGYMLDDRNKTAIRIDSAQFNQMTGGAAQKGANAQLFNDPNLLSDPAKLRAEIKSQGGKQIGTASILGHSCSIWEISKKGNIPAGQGKTSTETVKVKVWLAEDLVLPLKVDVSTDKRGQVAVMQARSLEVNIPIKASLFALPGGYRVTDLADMFKTQSRTNR
ncbi:hypothetical protein COW36_15410 [bacterium (Candidatus Blackallbacteria) CG17_big_fil_post_rev_8_21_14_2_50_48_46]|uniref:DUF4412 domain-containing protein n=1 Tax=bacterium (Candidatus Blackallbacteria) CG17_big_fil_post_rev_8_21_14_2_50_48_46 TaxID=2014261 RepID=A0A2M7G251_9BACT|nr:MAG: hypothetical protein COW64_16380 [bacterium (Candidatus Blackallbacteria) CG18_big_fil_WC_8_21_14_2_50_49_26]PIW15857.1 MAG: hypothetical protein COW36_15410 [bacterium (Candidatus Blackallbacteria) CG17_big_fil_post_rev_8_21_14_2_50_48_46]PIW49426.1 MAG: hypothetical protein COW20_05900 [bacterium (Candidatus Blackallbacteria) CG13_big_fil_rev_8_21_14_2_50_49_14]